MEKLRRPNTMAFVAVAALATVLAVNGPSEAMGGHGFAGGHPGGAVAHQGFGGHGFDGHHFDGRHFDGHHFDGHHFVGRFGFTAVFPYYGYYAPYYGYDPAPGYWYYCPSYGAYYPNVASCPEPWVPVPAS